MRPLLAVTTCLAALALGACGSSTKVVSDSPTSSSSAAAASATTSAGTSTTTTTTSTGVPSSTGTQCVASRLALSFLGQQGAAGHGELGFALRNSGAMSCHTFGYPGVLFLSATGGPLPTHSVRSTNDLFGPAPEKALVLGPGQSASFRLGVTHGVGSSAGCTTAHALQVIPPDDTHTVRVTIPGGAYECGTATVSPLQPGTGAYR